MIFELKTPKATFSFDNEGTGHFSFNCGCGGLSGVHYKNPDEDTENLKVYKPSIKKICSYQMNKEVLSNSLENFRLEKRPLIIVCDDCSREFPFTFDSFQELESKVKGEFDKGNIPWKKEYDNLTD